jgi:hypothetical protein
MAEVRIEPENTKGKGRLEEESLGESIILEQMLCRI